ncbi:hypothetical protein [Porcipelethomonas sp.]|uniref:hypothetical protein n=1 Tax=Porcipelethomonas sp. TaxID=2981675 RepID=UPI003EF1E501
MYIENGRLCDFLDGFIDIINESQAWEIWMNKRTGMTWEEFRLSVIPQDISAEEVENAQQSSENLYNNLCGMIGGER